MMKQADVVIIGARSLLANGSVVGAKGCGTVACVANEDQGLSPYTIYDDLFVLLVPVLVCCETYKFEDRCAINALDIKNEIREFPINEHITFANIVQDVIPASLVTAAITEGNLARICFHLASILSGYHRVNFCSDCYIRK